MSEHGKDAISLRREREREREGRWTRVEEEEGRGRDEHAQFAAEHRKIRRKVNFKTEAKLEHAQ
jgi:hypothetical protein